LEKRVLLRLLEDQLAREALGQPFRERRLADADRPLDDDETRPVAGDDSFVIAHCSWIPGRSRPVSGLYGFPAAASNPQAASNAPPAPARPRRDLERLRRFFLPPPSVSRCCSGGSSWALVHQSAISGSASPQRARNSRK